ncbi:MAG: FAD-dependent oxidoreductase [Candidatus Aminicenantes bacterium]|jgi:thioredoxin reductase (NADPH)
MNKNDRIETIQTEILIIGGGAAGLSAALYAARAGRDTLVLEGRRSSRLNIGYTVENYPGIISIESTELLEKFKTHAKHVGAEVVDEEAVVFSLASDPKFVTTRDKLFEAKAVILASGKPIALGRMFPGEEKLIGLGVSYCSTCDGPLFKGRPVAAVGNSDEAAEDVLALKHLGCDIHWILGDGKDVNVTAELSEKIAKKDIPVYDKSRVREIKGHGRVESVVFEREGVEKELSVMGVFVFRESPSAAQFSKAGLDLDHRQCVAVDRFQRTNLEGVFAAGDVTCGGMQIVSAAGEGCVAAMQAVKYLRHSDRD